MKNIKIILAILFIVLNYGSTARVVIIGAGVSGLRAGQLLKDKNFDVTILEARDRIGGRVWSDTSFGYPIELGAAWIHGAQDNPITKAANISQVQTVEFDYDNVNVLSMSLKKLDKEEAQNQMSDSLDNFISYLDDSRETEETDTSVENVLKNYLNDKKVNQTEESYLKNAVYAELEIEYGSPIENLSKNNFDSAGRGFGDDLLIPGGYIKIFEPIAQKLNILLNSTVTEIEQNDNQVTLKIEGNKNLQADYIIISVPLGCLKKNTIKFTPAISARKQSAIQKLGFGSMEKIIVEFTENFWGDFNLYKIIDNPVTIFNWFVNLSNVIEKNTLIFLVGGNENEKYFPFYTKTKANLEKALVDYLKKYFPNKKIQIKQSIMTKWKEDPFAYGSYTSYAPNSTPEDVEEFSKPEGRIHFAGEHTNVEQIQTVHGAYMSGERAANEIIKIAKTGSNFLK